MTTTVSTVQPIKPSNTVDLYKLEKVDAHSLFPDVYPMPGEVKVTRRVNRHPDCLPSNPNYVPDEIVLRRFLAWWHAPQRQAFGLHGETGTGKTELLQYVADKLNEPVYIIQMHSTLMPETVEGSRELVNVDGQVITQDKLGPLAKAYQQGGLIILDEVDKANDSMQAALHPVVEGKPWPIEQFSITIEKHAHCRLAGTANTTGEGGSLRYTTSRRMDNAFRSRFGWRELFYPDAATETAILTRNYAKLPPELRKKMVRTGISIRDAVYAEDSDVNAVFSTRTLVNWGHYMMVYGKDAQLRESLDFSFWGSVDFDSRDAVNSILQLIWDDTLDKPLGEVIESYA